MRFETTKSPPYVTYSSHITHSPLHFNTFLMYQKTNRFWGSYNTFDEIHSIITPRRHLARCGVSAVLIIVSSKVETQRNWIRQRPIKRSKWRAFIYECSLNLLHLFAFGVRVSCMLFIQNFSISYKTFVDSKKFHVLQVSSKKKICKIKYKKSDAVFIWIFSSSCSESRHRVCIEYYQRHYSPI